MKKNTFLALAIAAIFALGLFVNADSFAAERRTSKTLSKVHDGYTNDGATIVKFQKSSGDNNKLTPTHRAVTKVDSEEKSWGLWTRIIRLIKPDKEVELPTPYNPYLAPAEK
ncbi:hypothetical protein JXJ21_11170 [candidate division KSB1 bacterium]|nr:hypothetical protein [candidate division KSB1 bacterium]